MANIENNAHINARFIDLIKVLDARATVSVYELGADGKQKRIGDSSAPVYQILAEMDNGTGDFYKVKEYDVIGLVLGLVDRVLIKKGE